MTFSLIGKCEMPTNVKCLLLHTHTHARVYDSTPPFFFSFLINSHEKRDFSTTKKNSLFFTRNKNKQHKAHSQKFLLTHVFTHSLSLSQYIKTRAKVQIEENNCFSMINWCREGMIAKKRKKSERRKLMRER